MNKKYKMVMNSMPIKNIENMENYFNGNQMGAETDTKSADPRRVEVFIGGGLPPPYPLPWNAPPLVCPRACVCVCARVCKCKCERECVSV